MNTGRPRGFFYRTALLLLAGLVNLYPPGFRREFSLEVKEVYTRRIEENMGAGLFTWLGTILQEFAALVVSILRESWHEFRTRKEREMDPDNPVEKNPGITGQGGQAFQPAGTPGLAWIVGWTLLVTAAIPATAAAFSPLTIAMAWFLNLGAAAGFWPSVQASSLAPLGALTGFALILASVQWFLLRRFLPRAWLWFAGTVAIFIAIGLVLRLVLSTNLLESWDPFWYFSAILLFVGLALGLAHWLYLRRFLPNAAWIIVIDLMAAGSILLAGRTFTSLVELSVLILPGTITGVGLWLLLRQNPTQVPAEVQADAPRDARPWLPRLARTGLLLAALAPLFFACIWVYSASQLALAKSSGIYPTVEEAVIERNSQGVIGDAKVVSVQYVHARQNSSTLPHVWFGGATVTYDRVPQGYRRNVFLTGSYYLHVREGWVLVPEGAFPEFIGWVMELYGMEGVREWAAQN